MWHMPCCGNEHNIGIVANIVGKVNMYTGHLVRISWNCVYSNSFSVKHDIRQGAVNSPVLFCFYIDKLLCELESNGIGCFIGKMFVGALAYAEDIVLIAWTSGAMRRTLSTCDSLADNFSIVFNAKKNQVFNIWAYS